MAKYYVKRYEGNDAHSWALFCDLTPEQRKADVLFWPVVPMFDGMSRKEALYRKKVAEAG